MLTEKDLLTDILQNTPDNSLWCISSDSWEEIPKIFSNYISKNEMYGWNIFINQVNREEIIQLINREEVYEKIVHQYITYNHNIIFKSYDHMSGSYLKNSFPNFEKIIKKYEGQEIEVFVI